MTVLNGHYTAASVLFGLAIAFQMFSMWQYPLGIPSGSLGGFTINSTQVSTEDKVAQAMLITALLCYVIAFIGAVVGANRMLPFQSFAILGWIGCFCLIGAIAVIVGLAVKGAKMTEPNNTLVHPYFFTYYCVGAIFILAGGALCSGRLRNFDD